MAVIIFLDANSRHSGVSIDRRNCIIDVNYLKKGTIVVSLERSQHDISVCEKGFSWCNRKPWRENKKVCEKTGTTQTGGIDIHSR